MTEENTQQATQADKYVWKEGDIEMTQSEETTQEQPKVHGNIRKAADLSLSQREISPDSHKAVHEGRITLDEARELGREGSPFGPAKKTVSKKDRSRECMCGICGLTTKGGRFIPGHDQRVKGMIVKAVREGSFDQLSAEIREYAAERDLSRETEQRMADEEAKRQEKAEQKAAKREGENG